MAVPGSALQSAWEERLGTGRAHLDEAARSASGVEPELLVDGLLCLGTLVEGIGRLHPQKGTLVREPGKPGPALIAPILATDPRSVVAALRRLEEATASTLAFRERWRPFTPSWKATQERTKALLERPGFRWHWLEREDAARLLALAALLKDARSGDVALDSGKPATLDEVETWARANLPAAEWPIAQELVGKGAVSDEWPATTPEGVPPPPTATDGAVVSRLRSLRVASLERMVREATRGPRKTPRASVIAELRRHPSVRWVGETVVCWVE